LSGCHILKIPDHGGTVAIIADLHFKSYTWHGSNPLAFHGLEGRFQQEKLDGLIVAGDLSDLSGPSLQDALAYLTRYLPANRIYILPGNHDFYGSYLDDEGALRLLVESQGSNFIQKTELRHRDDRYFCATLWTDFNLSGCKEGGMQVAQRLMRDYEMISKTRSGSEALDPDFVQINRTERITPEDTLTVHIDHKSWLSKRLAAPHFACNGRTFVVTHHGPHISAAGKVDELTAAFHSNLDDIVTKNEIDCWYFGHSHRRLSSDIAGTRIQNVSLGYPGERHGASENDLAQVCFVSAGKNQ